MTGEKRTNKNEMLTLCVFPIYITPPLPACIMYDCREGRGVIYIGNTQSVSISFLFLFFFHQSSLYPIKIFAKCLYLLVIFMEAIFSPSQALGELIKNISLPNKTHYMVD